MTQLHLRESDIVAAANYIAAQGEIPTIAAVRQHLNGRGSETTILNYLRKWKIKLLAFAVYFDAEDLEPEYIFNLQKQNELLVIENDNKNDQIKTLQIQNSICQSENLVLLRGVKSLNEKNRQLQNTLQQLEVKVGLLQELNNSLNTIDALAQQKAENISLYKQIAIVKQDICMLLQARK